MGIEVINCGGKNNIESFYYLFKQFGFTVYTIFDCDKSKPEEKDKTAKLLKIITGNEKIPAKTAIESSYTAFDEDYETEFKKVMGGDYDKRCGGIMQSLGLTNKNKPIIAKCVSNQLKKEEIPPFVKTIIEKIVQ